MRLIVMMAFGWSIAGSSMASGWPLPLPSGPGDVSGALVMLGDDVYQAQDFGLQLTAEGGIAISWLQGYDQNGVSVRIERTIRGASSLGFARASVGLDGAGYLLVGRPGASVALSTPAYPCGMTRLWSCSARQCEHCGDAPGCACLDVSGGGCDPFTHDYCEGSCAAGACKPSGDSCDCIVGGGTPPPAKEPGGRKAQRLQPVNPPQ